MNDTICVQSFINTILHSDHQVVLPEDQQHMAYIVNKLIAELMKYGLEINIWKTQWLSEVEENTLKQKAK